MFSITDGQRDVFWQWDTGQFIAVNLAEVEVMLTPPEPEEPLEEPPIE